MTNRREFLQTGVAVTAAAALTSGFEIASATVAAPPPTRLHKAIYDRRFADSRAFAAQIVDVPAHAIEGDITELWFKDLDPHWRKAARPVAGLTTQNSLFCLEHLARDYGLRVTYRGEHIVGPGRRIRHDLTGPAHLLVQADDSQMRSAAWPREVARLMRGYELTRNARDVPRRISAELPAPAEPGVEILVSWIIAPARRRLRTT